MNPFAMAEHLGYVEKCRGGGLEAVCPVVRRDSSALPGRVEWGEAKVRFGLWVLTEGVAAVGATSGTASEKIVSIRSQAAVTALAAAIVSAAHAVASVVTGAASVAVIAAASAVVRVAAVAAASAAARAAEACLPRWSAKAPAR